MQESSLALKKDSISCKNCETQYIGNYCPECGQSSENYDKPFRFIIADFAGNIFSFDTRLWSTIRAVLTSPGQMAMDIMNGKRARYVPPFRLYVFVSFFFFLLINYSINKINESDELSVKQEEMLLDISNDSTGISEPTGIQEKKSDIVFKNKKVSIDHVMDNFEMYFSKLLQWFSYSLFLLMPFYAFLLWIFFRKTYKYYLGHLLLAINQHVFTFILLSIVVLIGQFFPFKTWYPEVYLLWFLPVYYLLGIRKMYQRKWSTSIMRFSVVVSIYMMLTFLILLTLTIYTLYALS